MVPNVYGEGFWNEPEIFLKQVAKCILCDIVRIAGGGLLFLTNGFQKSVSPFPLVNSSNFLPVPSAPNFPYSFFSIIGEKPEISRFVKKACEQGPALMRFDPFSADLR